MSIRIFCRTACGCESIREFENIATLNLKTVVVVPFLRQIEAYWEDSGDRINLGAMEYRRSFSFSGFYKMSQGGEALPVFDEIYDPPRSL